MIPLFAAAEPISIAVNTEGSSAVKMFLMLTALSFASAALISLTSFTRIIIVLSFLRQAIGAQQLPPNQVLLALTLALTGFVMAPTATAVHQDALGPYLDGKIAHDVAIERASGPVRTFLLKQTREQDLQLFFEIARAEPPARTEDIPLSVAVPAFMVSELTTAFRMGLYVYVPFVLIDLLISSILMALGMMMVPPAMISMPVKIGVFLLADGWNLIARALVRSFA